MSIEGDRPGQETQAWDEYVAHQLERLRRGLLWRYLGLVIGLLIAGGIYLKDNQDRHTQTSQTFKLVQQERWDTAFNSCWVQKQRSVKLAAFVSSYVVQYHKQHPNLSVAEIRKLLAPDITLFNILEPPVKSCSQYAQRVVVTNHNSGGKS